MFNKFTLTVAAFMVVAMLVVGCDSDDRPANPGIANEIVDSIAGTVSRNLNEASLARTKSMESPVKGSVKMITEIADLKFVGSKIYGAFDGGVVVYDFENKSYSVIPSKEKFTSVALHDEKVYVGGENLYTVNDAALERVDEEFDGPITALFSYGYRLMVGTESGLYSTGIFGHELLFDDVAVSAMTADESGLWVGTQGEGLYRWDGEDFKRRYLHRDTTIFDTVCALDFNRRHVYVGTPNGFHIFDGGSWRTLTALDGLPGDRVVAVDASEWVIYIGTDMGVISYFNGDFIPVEQLAQTPARSLAVQGRKVIVGTDDEGLLMKSGNVLKTLAPVDNGMTSGVLSSVP